MQDKNLLAQADCCVDVQKRGPSGAERVKEKSDSPRRGIKFAPAAAHTSSRRQQSSKSPERAGYGTEENDDDKGLDLESMTFGEVPQEYARDRPAGQGGGGKVFKRSSSAPDSLDDMDAKTQHQSNGIIGKSNLNTLPKPAEHSVCGW